MDILNNDNSQDKCWQGVNESVLQDNGENEWSYEWNIISTFHDEASSRRRLQRKVQAQAADFYMPNQFSDNIVLKKGCPWMRDWPDHDLVNTKQGWESLGVINWNLILGDHYDYAGHAYSIPQTMSGIELEVDSEEFQEWYSNNVPITSNFWGPVSNQCSDQ
jgi:hypothetical protein